MKNQSIKIPLRSKAIKEPRLTIAKTKTIIRIDEERLFKIFTADIMNMKTKFTR